MWYSFWYDEHGWSQTTLSSGDVYLWTCCVHSYLTGLWCGWKSISCKAAVIVTEENRATVYLTALTRDNVTAVCCWCQSAELISCPRDGLQNSHLLYFALCIVSVFYEWLCQRGQTSSKNHFITRLIPNLCKVYCAFTGNMKCHDTMLGYLRLLHSRQNWIESNLC